MAIPTNVEEMNGGFSYLLLSKILYTVLKFIKFILSLPNEQYDMSSSCGVKGFSFLGVWPQIILIPSKT